MNVQRTIHVFTGLATIPLGHITVFVNKDGEEEIVIKVIASLSCIEFVRAL
jgi:hypothetical protein